MNKHPFQQIEHSLHDLTRPKRSHTFWGFCLVLVCTMVLLYPKNSTWLAYPNNFMIGDSVDGFKNNMTTAWHVGRDTAYVHYRGMNYPNGEHILFTDMQPIFAMTMQWWNHNISDISGNTVAIINFLELFSTDQPNVLVILILIASNFYLKKIDNNLECLFSIKVINLF
jgi:hypothetical protein